MRSDTGWLSLDETAAYLSMGKTSLYKLARAGRMPARKIGKKWLFEKADLDAWIRTKEPLESFFLNLDFNIGDNGFLREPQHDGYLRTYEFFRAGKNKAILQIPVGCGKTGLAALLPPRSRGRARYCHRAEPDDQKRPLRRDGHNKSPEMLLAEDGRLEQRPNGSGTAGLHTGDGQHLRCDQISYRHHEHPAARHERRQVAYAISWRFLRHDYRRRGTP